MFLARKILIVLLCGSLLVACSIPSKRQPQPPISAEELAISSLPPPRRPVVKQPPVTQPIPELPTTQPEPLQEVNQEGMVPSITTLNEQSIDFSNLKLDDDDPIALDFEQVALQDILKIISDALDIHMIIDPTIGDKVTLRTDKDKPLKKEDLWSLLQLLLNDAGISMEKRGGVYHVKKTGQSTLPGAIGLTPGTLINSTSAEVLQITPLRYLTAENAKTVIEPLIQPNGRVLILPSLNVIGIITTPIRLERVNKLLHIIDADPFLHRGIRLFRLINSKAKDVQAELDKILKALAGGGNAQSTYQVIALERINAILVVAPPNSGFTDVALWVDILDERSEESGEQIFIYNVKNLEASKLASTLTNVFKVEDKKAAEEKEKLKRNQQAQQAKDGESEPESPLPLSPPGTGDLPVSAELKVNIVADESTNSLLIRSNARDYRQLLDVITRLDRVPKEVMVNAVIAEVTLTEANSFGIDWRVLLNPFRSQPAEQISVGNNFSVPGGNLPGSENPAGGIGSLSSFTINYLSGSLNALLNLISSKGKVTILSRPSLLVRNNEEALINVGTEEPYKSGETINTSSGINNQFVSNQIQYKDTGISVKVTPRINDDGIINMKIEQKLTQAGAPKTVDGQVLQPFQEREIETHVVVRDGTTIVIGGLIQVDNQNNRQGIPGLQDLPLFGKFFFSSSDDNKKRTELVLIIVPDIVNPEADNRPLVQNYLRRIKTVAKLLNEQNVFLD
jgi:general secretion pathway protein D